MNPRKIIDFFKTKTGQITLFAGLVAIALTLFYGYRQNSAPADDEQPSAEVVEDAPAPSSGPSRVQRDTPSLDLPDNLQKAEEEEPAHTPSSTAEQPEPPPPLPISLFNAGPDKAKQLSKQYAPYGRLIPCETIITIDSAKIETPIIGFVTEDLYHAGRLLIPAGAEIHGKAQTDRSRERIGSDSNWIIVWRTTDSMNGVELPLKGVALDMERDYANGTWALTDGSAGLKGDLIKSDKLAEIKLFAATFLSATAAGLQDTQTTTNPVTGERERTPLDSPKNATLEGISEVVNEYARQIQQAIERDGFYVRVPAGKQFYLYVTQTIDLQEASRGQTALSDTQHTTP